ncbi:MAG TPA: pseudouridine synthase [Fimbriimonadaceae bacterium]|nr:pseudouridine synthase [Fimbriimonadaceae bacterium]HRJ97636.1 pseudouridine synthase [Fimbriimonadaceae bacterium]
MERLHKFIASAGVCSRRAAEDLIRTGRVEVNGEMVSELGVKVGEEDEVRVDGEIVRPQRKHYILLNKPKGVVTTMRDPQNRPTILRYVPELGVTLKPVGRLDMDSEGLLLLTNDGELAARLTHPRYGVEKEYVAVVRGEVGDKALARLQKGVFVDGSKTAPAKVEAGRYDPKRGTSRLTLVLHEGRNRQVRLMGEAVGHPVVDLRRTRIAFLRLRDLPPGGCRALSKTEIASLRRLVGLES